MAFDMTDLYVCPECLKVSEIAGACHGKDMICCYTGEWGDERRKPVTDPYDRLLSRAPRWYLEAVGWIQAHGRYTPIYDFH